MRSLKPSSDNPADRRISGLSSLGGEHTTAHHALTQAHGVVRKIAIGENHGETLANTVISDPFAAISIVVSRHGELLGAN